MKNFSKPTQHQTQNESRRSIAGSAESPELQSSQETYAAHEPPLSPSGKGVLHQQFHSLGFLWR